jgi:hypothetical protein
VSFGISHPETLFSSKRKLERLVSDEALPSLFTTIGISSRNKPFSNSPFASKRHPGGRYLFRAS